ncbi:hypothetical protein LEMLEM_LOCUS5581 [Lemmus lemmus]
MVLTLRPTRRCWRLAANTSRCSLWIRRTWYIWTSVMRQVPCWGQSLIPCKALLGQCQQACPTYEY